MDEPLLIEKHPTLFHMAEPGTWESIRKHGLLSTEAFIDHLGATDAERTAILKQHRRQSVIHRTAFIRDQKPMNHNLVPCLQGSMSPEEWFELLNGKVFFWTTAERLITFRAAYRMKRQLILEVPTNLLLQAFKKDITLCAINSGASRMPNHFRNRDSFQPVAHFQYSSRRKLAELTVKYAVPNIAKFVSHAYEVGGNAPIQVLHPC